jgi:hypothetical protein
VYRHSAAVRGAAIAMAALGLSGCSPDPVPPAPTATISSVAAPPGQAQLPAPEALTDVMTRLADVSVPGAQKVALVQYATPEEAAALDRFAHALADNRLPPLDIRATDLAWAAGQPGDVVATISIASAAPDAKPFVYPMQFTPAGSGWQLTRATADQLLDMGQDTSTPVPPR